MTTNLLPEFIPGFPEIFLAFASIVLLLVGAFQKRQNLLFVYHLGILALILTLLMTLGVMEEGPVFNEMLIINKFTQYAKALILLSVICVLWVSKRYLANYNLAKFEFPVLIMLATLGMMLMVSANDLLALFIGLELLSLSLYVLVAFPRDDLHSNEAALKYFVLGAVSTVFLLYGASLIYGYTGTIQFSIIASVLKTSPDLPIWVYFGLTMVFVGMAFKLSLVPFHMWTPDVYEGSPLPVTFFLAAGPKVAAFAMFLQIFTTVYGPQVPFWENVILGVALASIVLGAFAALFQNNLKRLFAYSTISHMGFLMLGLMSRTQEAYQNIFVYVLIYTLTTIAIFACLMTLRAKKTTNLNMDFLAGLSKQEPALCLCFTLMLFSLAGVPPLGGFFAKLGVLQNAIQGSYLVPVVIAVLASVVSAAYYLKVIRLMYFSESTSKTYEVEISRSLRFVLYVSTILVSLYALYPQFILNNTTGAAALLAIR